MFAAKTLDRQSISRYEADPSPANFVSEGGGTVIAESEATRLRLFACNVPRSAGFGIAALSACHEIVQVSSVRASAVVPEGRESTRRIKPRSKISSVISVSINDNASAITSVPKVIARSMMFTPDLQIFPRDRDFS